MNLFEDEESNDWLDYLDIPKVADVMKTTKLELCIGREGADITILSHDPLKLRITKIPKVETLDLKGIDLKDPRTWR